jgi:hypothetical protein
LAKYLKRTAKATDPLLYAIASHSPLAPIVPLCHLLRASARLFLLTELELLLATYYLEEMGWAIDNPVVVEHADNMRDLIWSQSDRVEYRRASLMMLLVFCWAKAALNDDSERLFQEAEKVCFDFKEIFLHWRDENMQ